MSTMVRVWAGLLIASLLLFAAFPADSAPPKASPAGADSIREQQSKFKNDRASAASSGLTKMFGPEWYDRADAFAKQGEEALAANRLVEAREDFRRARWNLPAPPPGLPENISRIFGDGRLRHTDWVQAVAFSPDGQRLATGSQDSTVKIWDV
jgi:WD40 repeat protein